MRDWIVIIGIALLSAAVGYLALRRRPLGAAERGSEPRAVKPPPPKPVPAPREAPAAAQQLPPKLPEPAAPLAVLVFDSAPGRVAVVRPEVVIGRHSEDDIRVPDVRVSRHHARLVAKRGGGFEIHNLTAVRSEPNIMLINGEAREHADIADGDIVSLGGVNFTFRSAA